MSPRKEPTSLFNLCIKGALSLIYSRCYCIENNYPDIELKDCKEKIYALKGYLMDTLPSRLIDALCWQRDDYQYCGDPRFLLSVLIHPNMTIFRKCDVDDYISQPFWIETIPSLTHLVVLDINYICTDELLKIVSTKCPLLEELNIVVVSAVFIFKSELKVYLNDFSIQEQREQVSDVGLCYISKLKNLRILYMDPPLYNSAGITRAGIILLLCELPCLEELNIVQSFDIKSDLMIGPDLEDYIKTFNLGSTIIGANINVELSLRKVSCDFAPAEGIRKLIKTCPHLKELSITMEYWNDDNSKDGSDNILEEITTSNLRLTKLRLSFFPYTQSLQRLLEVQGMYLTHLSIWDIDHSISIDSIVAIGSSCPNLNSLCLMTQSNILLLPRFFRRPEKMFSELRCLILGDGNFDLGEILLFFLDYATKLKKLKLKYETKLVFGEIMLDILQKGYLKNICNLWLDRSLEVSKDVVKQIIQSCDKLTTFEVKFVDETSEVLQYINTNNLDLKLGCID